MAGGQNEADDDSAANHAELRAEYERLLKTQSTGNITEQTGHHSNRLHGRCVCVKTAAVLYHISVVVFSLCNMWPMVVLLFW